MINVVAIDDEPLALELIETYCKRIDAIKSFTSFTKTDLAFAHLSNNAVDILLLDINMPAISGLEFYKQLQVIKPKLIFTTSYSEYALDGFDVGAIDYLLKPFNFERFNKAIQRVIDNPSLQKTKQVQDDFILLKSDYTIIKVVLSEILFIEGLDNYLKIYFQNKPAVVVRMTLKNLLEILPVSDFVRVHRSYIIGKNHIQSIKPKIIFIGEEGIPISKNYEEDVKKFFKL